MYRSEITKIILAEDHPFFRRGLKLVLEEKPYLIVVAETGEGKEVLDLIEQYKPDLVLMDIYLPDIDGITLTRKITESFKKVKVIALSMSTEEVIVKKMLEAGARGYIDKNCTSGEIYEAIREVVDLDSRFFPYFTKVKLNELLTKMGLSKSLEEELIFSSREVQIIQLVCKDFSNKEIALELNLSERTVEAHRFRIMKKMNVKTMAGMVAYAFQHKLVLS